MFDPTCTSYAQLSAGNSASVTATGTDAPASGLSWDIVQGTQTFGTSNLPNGWGVSYSGSGPGGSFTITVPSNAASGQNYEVRLKQTPLNGNSFTASAFFDVIAQSHIPAAMGSFPVAVTGNDAPANNQIWDVVYQGSIIATSTIPRGWTASLTVKKTTINVSAPSWAAFGGGYEVRYYDNSQQPPNTPMGRANFGTRRRDRLCGRYGANDYSGTFTLVPPHVSPVAGTKYFVEANGARIPVTAATIPSANNPSVACSVPAGVPLQVSWNYDPNNAFGTYAITFANRTKLVTGDYSNLLWNSVYNGNNNISVYYELAKLVDRNGNSLQFNYGAAGNGGFPMLSAIADKNGSALLSFTRAADGSGNLLSVTDRYGRSVAYQIGTFATSGAGTGWPLSFQEVTRVSQVVPGGTQNPPDRYVYGYQTVYNNWNEGAQLLHTITVPSPTGVGTSVATINYVSRSEYVSSVTDGNGNTASFNFVDPSHNQVKITDVGQHLIYSYTVGFDQDMSGTTITNGLVDLNGNNTTIVYSADYGDAHDPYRPSEVQDGNGYQSGGLNGKGTWTYTWDSFGHVQTATNPYGTKTTYTWNYANFPLGELTSVQQGSKSHTSIAYYEPTGLVKTITAPLPGTTGSQQTVTYSATYSPLGNMLTLTTPGNNATLVGGVDQGITTTFNYTTDGGYSQPEALGQPVAVTDNLGKVTHFRYDNHSINSGDPLANTGMLKSVTDALGNEIDLSYNLDNQRTQVSFPATGQTGGGHGYIADTYLYTGGPVTQVALYDESGNQVRYLNPTYGYEGEVLKESGTLWTRTFQYDGAYRLTKLTDGNNNATTYSYTQGGYLYQILYPNQDSFSAASFDYNGNITVAQDGRGVQYNLSYNDNESRLTDIQYPGSTNLNAHVAYDGYGRPTSRTDGTTSQTYGWDDDDLPVFVNGITGPAQSFTVRYGFYPDASLQQLGTTAGNFSYLYNARGDLTSLTNPFNETCSWTYLDNGWLWGQRVGTSATTAYTYNALGQITDLSNYRYSDNTLLSEFGSARYDGAGDLTQLSASLPQAAPYSGTTTYGYDPKSELTAESSTRNGGYTESFGYDTAGNPTTFRGVGQTFNSDNQNQAISYDGAGNPKSWQGNSLTFDANDKLSALGTLLNAGYDSRGLRTAKQVGSGTTYFVYAGSVPIAEYDQNQNLLAVNTWGPNGLCARHTTANGGSSTFYTFDLQGNAAQRLNSSGGVLGSYCFDGYGTRSSTDNSVDPYSGYGAQWGYYRDAETGLSLLGERYYDPAQGRFLNRDPIGYRGGINLYAYVGNNPLTGIDPQGLQAGKSPIEQDILEAEGEEDSSKYDPMEANQGYTPGLPLLPDSSETPGEAPTGGADGGPEVVDFSSVTPSPPGEIYDLGSGDASGDNGGNAGSFLSNFHKTFRPGPYANGYVVWEEGKSRGWTSDLVQLVNQLGDSFGCHTCGAGEPGTKSGNWIPDHQPPNTFNFCDGDPVALFPHCLTCSNLQGGIINGMKKKGLIP